MGRDGRREPSQRALQEIRGSSTPLRPNLLRVGRVPRPPSSVGKASCGRRHGEGPRKGLAKRARKGEAGEKEGKKSKEEEEEEKEEEEKGMERGRFIKRENIG